MSIIYGNVKPTFMEIYPDWKYITKTSPKKTVLRAGTPLGANGRVANNSSALGLVAEDTGISDNPISIIVSGVVDYAKVQASYTQLSIECRNALKGILFINSSGKVDTTGAVPDFSNALPGDVLTIDSNYEPAWTSGGGSGGMLVRFAYNSNVGHLEPQNHTLAEIITAAQSDQPVIFQWVDFDFTYCAPAVVIASGPTAVEVASACGTGYLAGGSPTVSTIANYGSGWEIVTLGLVTNDDGGEVEPEMG